MTQEEMLEIFDDAERDEYLKFSERVEPKRSSRPDLHAFLLLDELVPSDSDIVSGAEHDEIWLGVDIEKLAVAITRDQIIELVCCGVVYNSDTESLSMFA